MKLDGWSIEQVIVDWIYNNIPENSIILELGSGYGTADLVKKYKVYSVEEDKKWLNLIPDSNYIYAPLKDNWYDISFIEKIDPDYKLLLIDGPAGGNRYGILKHIKSFYNGATIIVDDAERPDDLKVIKELCSMLNKSYIIKTGNKKSFAIIK